MSRIHRSAFRDKVQPKRHQHRYEVVGSSGVIPDAMFERCSVEGCGKTRHRSKGADER